MKVAVLTTQTPHHAYFVAQLLETAAVGLVVSEQQPVVAPFPTAHPFEQERDAHERETLVDGREPALGELAPTIELASVNDPTAYERLRAFEPEVVFVYGTRRVDAPIFELPGAQVVNFHGGDPEEYRGLDTHLWAIYHRDFGALVTTLHRVDAGLDTGAILRQDPLPVSRGTGIHELRSLTARLCVEQARSLLAGEQLSERQQRRRGRYYSFMPAVLKDACVRTFQAHVDTL